MKNVLVVGAGRSSQSLISYLLAEAAKHGWLITVADAEPTLAKKRIAGHKCGLAVWLDAMKPNDRRDLVKRVDLVISLLPPSLHNLIAEDCLHLNKHLLTASYVDEPMLVLDELVRNRGLIFLGEMGLDPGLDHMSAVEKIGRIKGSGGTITSFRSYTGGLVAPQSDDNPWHYKITWNPRNVVGAGKGTTQYLTDGRYKFIPYHKLFKVARRVAIEGIGELEMYPNRDSLTYRNHYGLDDIPNLLRGTLRYPGFCAGWSAIVELGLTDDITTIRETTNLCYRDMMEALVPDGKGHLGDRISKLLDIPVQGSIMKQLEWLGLFSNKRVQQTGTLAVILENLLVDKWGMAPNDKDLVVMQHEFDYDLEGIKRTTKSTMVVEGIDRNQTAMSMLVGLPLAIGAKLIMQGKITKPGVRIPVFSDIYQPVLEELRTLGVKFVEREAVRQ